MAEVWVDFGYSGMQFGSQDQPFKTIGTAKYVVAPGGAMKCKTGQTAEKPRIDRPMTVRAMGGPVVIGRVGAVTVGARGRAPLFLRFVEEVMEQ